MYKKTESNEYPKIKRRAGKILFPANIKEVQKEREDGTLETFYEYDLYELKDRGQDISDYEKFKLENYAELRRMTYADLDKQLEMQYDGTWEAHVQEVKAMFPKGI